MKTISSPTADQPHPAQVQADRIESAARKVWIDGALVDKSEARISVYDHGLLYGDGVFEGIRVYSGRIFEADAHLRRLYDSAKAIRLVVPYTHDQLMDAMTRTIEANAFSDCYLRLVVTRGAGYLGLNPNKCAAPCTFCIADTMEMYPGHMYEKGMAVITATVIRNHPNAISPRIKSLNYLNNILAKLEAEDAEVPEAIMLNHNGNVSECSGDNIFIVQGGVIATPTTADGILAGITRQTILTLCRMHNIPCVEKCIQRHDLYIADECFLTGSAAEVVPVTNIDRRAIGNGEPGPITRRLMDLFHRHVRAG